MPEREPTVGPSSSTARSEAVYQELILDHYRRPRNRGALENADVTIAHRNPLCGDELTVALRLDGECVADARFTGQGCAISQAAASMLTSAVRGTTITGARTLLARYRSMVTGDVAAASDSALGDLLALSGVARLPARVRCALLPADALSRAMDEAAGVRTEWDR